MNALCPDGGGRGDARYCGPPGRPSLRAQETGRLVLDGRKHNWTPPFAISNRMGGILEMDGLLLRGSISQSLVNYPYEQT